VNQGSFGDLTVSSSNVTQSLGWTVGSNRFFVLQIAGTTELNANINSVTAYAGATPYAMTLAADMDGSHGSAVLYYLPNASAINSINVNFNNLNGSQVDLIAAEYSGMSTTASVINPAVTLDSGYTSAMTWSVGPYTATAGNLLLTGTTIATYATADALTPGTGWSEVGALTSGSSGWVDILQQQLSVPAGSYNGTGTSSLSADVYYNSYIVSFGPP
jgi:hypothetical protein